MSRLPLWLSFAGGAALGGLVTGLGIAVLGGLLSPLPPTWRAAAGAAVIVTLVAKDLLEARLRFPQRNTLIPQEVFARGLLRGFVRFGFEYGSGVRTLIPSASSLILAAFLIVANLPWWQTALIGLVFGFSRTLAVLLFLLWGSDGWASFLGRHSRVLERAGSVGAAIGCLWALAALVIG